MKISVRKPDPKSYNASILSVDRFEKTVTNAIHNVFVNTATNLPITTLMSYYTWDLLFDLMIDVQAMHFTLSNWNKSFNTSKFTLPELEDYVGEAQIQEDPEVKVIDKNRVTTASDDEEQLLKTSNNGITIIAKNSLDMDKSMRSFLIDKVGVYDEPDYIGLIVLISYIRYVIEFLFIIYNYARNDDGKFALLMKLKSRQNGILDKVPKFPKIPKSNDWDFEGAQTQFPSVCKVPIDPTQKLRDKYNVYPLFHIEPMQVMTQKMMEPESWFTEYNSWGDGFFWRTDDEPFNVNGVIVYKVKGYWSGFDNDLISRAFFYFEGFIQNAIPETNLDYVFINDILQTWYFIAVYNAKGIVQSVNIKLTTE